jgi:hypothetical protein
MLATSRCPSSRAEPSVLARSGTRPVLGFACSQKKRNERLERSSRKRFCDALRWKGVSFGDWVYARFDALKIIKRIVKRR